MAQGLRQVPAIEGRHRHRSAGLDYIATVPPAVALVADTYGRRNVGIVYGWVYLSHMPGAAVLAEVAGLIRAAEGALLIGRRRPAQAPVGVAA